jgi:hypothetical protein
MIEPSDDEIIKRLQSQSKSIGPHAKPIRTIMKTLLVKRGINDEQAALDLEAAWLRVVDTTLAGETRVGRIHRGNFTVWVRNSLALQELDFRRAKLLEAMKKELPHLKLRDLRFRSEG